MPFSELFKTRNNLPRVSDFHFKSGQQLRMRIDGQIEVVPNSTILNDDILKALLYPLLNEAQIKQFEEFSLKDIDMSYQLPEFTYNFRVNIFRERTGLAAVIRLLPDYIAPVEQIGIPNQKIIEKVFSATRGLIIVSGITGSGKSTTVASFLQHFLNTRKCRIISLEDPIEYIFTDGLGMISQREVGKHFSSFTDGLKSAMRENPDIINVGEMRDYQTIRLALDAANTGHLVFSTTHSSSTTGTLIRIVNAFPSEDTNEIKSMLALSLNCIMCQMLVPRADHRGVLPAMEFVFKTKAIENILRTGKYEQLHSMMETGYNEGMVTMQRSLVDLYERNMISLETAQVYSGMKFGDA